MTLLTLLKETSGGGGVTVGYRASSKSGTSDVLQSNIAVPVPTGATAGDIALLAVKMWNAGNPTITWPAGFTEKVSATTGSNLKLKIAWKRLTGADSGSYTPTWTGTQWTMGMCILITGGIATGDPIEATNTATGSGTSIPSTTLTTATLPFLAHFVHNDDGSASGTPPTSYTEVQDADYMKTNYRIPGSTGSHTASGGTVSASVSLIAALLAVMPDAGGGPTTHTLTADGSSAVNGSADLSLRVVVSGSGSGASAGSASLALRLPLNGSGASAGTGSTALTLRLPLAATGASAATGSADLSAKLAATATGAATAAGTADLTLTGAGPVTHALTATGAGTATGSAALRLRAALSAAGSATPGGSALLKTRLAMTATGGSTSIGSAYLTALWLITAFGAASSSGSADLVLVGALPPITERPFVGLTERPAGAPPVITRPASGTTSRPTGAPPTTRPDAGTTSRP